MGVCGAIAVLVAELPRLLQPPLALAALAWGAWSALREHRRTSRVFVIHPDASATLDDMPLRHVHVHWRGALAFVRARDVRGRRYRLDFWPDTLDARGRRALRLAAGAMTPLAAAPRGMRG